MADEPNSPHGGLRTNHEQNEQEQYPWAEQVPKSYEPDPLRGEEQRAAREAGGRQDKTAGLQGRVGSPEPGPKQNGTGPLTNDERVQNKPRQTAGMRTSQNRVKANTGRRNEDVPTRGKRVHTVSWLQPILRAELQRIAEQKGLSLSATIASLLDKAVQQNLHEQHDALLQPMVRQAVRHEMRTLSNRLASLVVSILLGVIEIRQLLVNVLVRVPADPQMSEAVLNDIRDGSAKRARQEVRQQSPQLKTLIEEEMARWND